MNAREKREIIRKLNVVISAFYSDIGIQAICSMSAFVDNAEGIKEDLNINLSWSDKDFRKAVKMVDTYQYKVSIKSGSLTSLKNLLSSKRSYLLSLFNNTNLLEHDTFTEMLWAVFHTMDELESRDSLEPLPEQDINHLSVDISRAYKLLVHEWLYYMKHLGKEYPYLYSLAIRKNPFLDNISVIFH